MIIIIIRKQDCSKVYTCMSVRKCEDMCAWVRLCCK